MVSFSRHVDTMSRHQKLFTIFIFAIFVGLAGLWSLPPLDRDEARFAQATIQMLETGDYVAIRFLDEERNKKPAGIHWLQSASVAIFSDPAAREIWAFRLPSFFSVIAATFFVFLIGEKLFNSQTGFYAAILFASAPVVAAEATIAKTDAVLLLAVCIAQWALASIATSRQSSLPKVLIFWTAISASILIKGPIGPTIIGLCAGYLIITKKISNPIKNLNLLLGIIIILVITLPWAFAINDATQGRFFTEAIGGDLFAKVGKAQEQHSGPPGYHFLFMWVLFWPAVTLLPRALYALATQRTQDGWCFLFAWIVPAWILFELTGTKLPHYTLPLYPALAIAAAHALNLQYLPYEASLKKIGIGIYVFIGIIFATTIIAAPHLYATGGIHLGAILAAAITLIATVYIGYLFNKNQYAHSASLSAALLAGGFAWAMMNSILPSLDRLQLSPKIADAVKTANLHELKDRATPSFLSGYTEPSAVFLLGSGTKLGSGAAAAQYLLKTPNAAIIVANKARQPFLDYLENNNANATVLAEIEGFNYSKGDNVSITIFVNAHD